MNISLYYYDANRDKDQSGNLLCSAQGLVTLERTVPMFAKEIDRITAAVRLLLAGDITKEEVTRGVTSEFPLSGVTLTNVTIDDDGVVTLSFEDPLLKTSGGSCRVAILWAQISATVRQFPGVTDVRFAPEELFQP